MKVKIVTGENRDGYEHQEMTINDRYIISVYPLCECPEDAIIGRNLISCSEIADLMKKAYDAGKAGEEWEFTEEKEE